MKYEMIFGDDDFSGQSNELAEVKLWNDLLGPNFVSMEELHCMSAGGLIPRGSVILAMRRIIRTPTWTAADQKAGKLLDVGCRIYVPIMFEEQTVIYSSEKVIVSISDNGGAVTRTEVSSIDLIKPIESQEEKSARLKDEWVEAAIYETVKRKETTNDEHERLKARLGDVYRALLSGELAVPKGGE